MYCIVDAIGIGRHLINYVEIISLISLLDDNFPRNSRVREHGIEYVTSLVLIQMAEQNILGNGFRERSHSLVILGDDLKIRSQKTNRECPLTFLM